MILNHNNYINYELPMNWCAEENGDSLFIYNPNGNGAMTLSFYNMLEVMETLDEQISIMAKKFIEQNKIVIHTPLIIYGSKETKTTLYGTGTTPDNWFIKLWIIAKQPKIVLITYQSEKKSKEVKKCDSIVESMEFTFDEQIQDNTRNGSVC